MRVLDKYEWEHAVVIETKAQGLKNGEIFDEWFHAMLTKLSNIHIRLLAWPCYVVVSNLMTKKSNQNDSRINAQFQTICQTGFTIWNI